MRRWPSESRCAVASRRAALVVDHDGVAVDLGEPPVDLDDVDAVPREQRRRGAVGRRHDHAGRAHREERPRAGELLRRGRCCRETSTIW